MASQQGQQVAQARLGLLNGNASDDFIFPLVPRRMPHNYDAVYVPVPVALADYSPNTPSGNPSPVAWNRNQPERLNLDFLLIHPDALSGQRLIGNDTEPHIEDLIKKLESFRYKRRQTREPPDLVWSYGPEVHRVRLEKLSIDPKLWAANGNRLQADCTMQLIIIKARSR